MRGSEELLAEYMIQIALLIDDKVDELMADLNPSEYTKKELAAQRKELRADMIMHLATGMIKEGPIRQARKKKSKRAKK